MLGTCTPFIIQTHPAFKFYSLCELANSQPILPDSLLNSLARGNWKHKLYFWNVTFAKCCYYAIVTTVRRRLKAIICVIRKLYPMFVCSAVVFSFDTFTTFPGCGRKLALKFQKLYVHFDWITEDNPLELNAFRERRVPFTTYLV